MRDAVSVQPEHRVPDAAKLGIGRPGVLLGQRRPLVMLEGEREGLGADPDQGLQPGGAHPGLLGRVAQQRPALHRPVQRNRRAVRHLALQPRRTVQPVDRAGRLLVPVVHADVEPVTAARRRRVPAGLMTHDRDPAYLQQLASGAAQGRRDLVRRRALRHGARGVPHADPDRPADEQRDEQGEHGRLQRRQVHHRVQAEGQPHGRTPAFLPVQADHGGVRGQAGQVPVERRGAAGARPGHGERLVQQRGCVVAEQGVRHRHRHDRENGRARGLGQPSRLAPDELADGQGDRQQQQREQRHRPRGRQQRVRQPPARPHDVGLDTGGRGPGRDADRGQQDDLDAAHEAAHQIYRLADPAGKMILDQQRLRSRGRGRDRARGLVRRRARPRRRHVTIVSPGQAAA